MKCIKTYCNVHASELIGQNCIIAAKQTIEILISTSLGNNRSMYLLTSNLRYVSFCPETDEHIKKKQDET